MNNDDHSHRGQQWLDELLHLSGLPATAVVTSDRPASEESCWLTIQSDQLSPNQIRSLTGEHGESLDAIQYLANTILNLGQPEELQHAFTIELNGYRARRQAELQAMAEEAARQVRETGEEFEMAALSAAERRQVHTLLKPFEDLETYSRGREPDRRLVVRRSQLE